MVEIPGNDITLRSKIAQKKVKTEKVVRQKNLQPNSTQKNITNPTASEQIVLSAKAKNIQKAQETVKSSPDIRTEKVNRIKKEIADGTFRVDSGVLAEKILEDMIKESKFLE